MVVAVGGIWLPQTTADSQGPEMGGGGGQQRSGGYSEQTEASKSAGGAGSRLVCV